MKFSKTAQFLVSGFLLLTLGGCNCSRTQRDGIRVNGSSTVYPITEAVAEEYQKQSQTRVTIGVSGTGGGFQKLCRGKSDIIGASRSILESEKKECKKHGITYEEIPIAYDGIAVVVNSKNDWVDYLSVAELKKIWEPSAQRKIKLWSQVRRGFPAVPLDLYAPGVDSGTFDFFTKEIVGVEHSSRGDVTSAEDDNVLVHGVASSRNSLGYFGFAYYQANRHRIRAIPILNPGKSGQAKPVACTFENIRNKSYAPLSRPIFIYVSKKARERADVDDFVQFYKSQSRQLAAEVGYVPLE